MFEDFEKETQSSILDQLVNLKVRSLLLELFKNNKANSSSPSPIKQFFSWLNFLHKFQKLQTFFNTFFGHVQKGFDAVRSFDRLNTGECIWTLQMTFLYIECRLLPNGTILVDDLGHQKSTCLQSSSDLERFILVLFKQVLYEAFYVEIDRFWPSERQGKAIVANGIQYLF